MPLFTYLNNNVDFGTDMFSVPITRGIKGICVNLSGAIRYTHPVRPKKIKILQTIVYEMFLSSIIYRKDLIGMTIYQNELELTDELLKQWFEAKTPVLIDSPPGSGKTYNIRSSMHTFAEKYKIRILATAPRKETVANIKKECDGCSRIKVMTIQALQNMEPQSMMDYINQFQIVVLDEVHAMVSDEFADDNHIFMETLIEEYDGLIIGMTGTNFFHLEDLFTVAYGKTWNMLQVARDYSFLQDNSITFFQSVETAAYIIRHALTSGEKIFVGCDYIEDLEKLRQGYEEQSFVIISDGNQKKGKMCRQADKKSLMNTGYYPKGKNILFCTRAYELGTNIKDDVKTILLWSDDLTTLVQFSRRVRIMHPGQQVKIYVKAFNGAELTIKCNEAEVMLKQSRLYEEDKTAFWAKNYRKVKDPSGIVYTAQGEHEALVLRIDKLKQAYWKARKEVFGVPEMRYWVHMVCSVFGGCAFKVLSKPQLVDFIKRHEGRTLNKEQNKELKKVSGQKTIAGINQACEQEGLEQRVVVERENCYVNGKRTQPRVWKIVKV